MYSDVFHISFNSSVMYFIYLSILFFFSFFLETPEIKRDGKKNPTKDDVSWLKFSVYCAIADPRFLTMPLFSLLCPGILFASGSTMDWFYREKVPGN